MIKKSLRIFLVAALIMASAIIPILDRTKVTTIAAVEYDDNGIEEAIGAFM